MTGRRRYVAALDQGTTSTRAVIVDESGREVGVGQYEHRQILPRQGLSLIHI